MYREIRMHRVLHYSAEGMIAWIPSIIVAALIDSRTNPALAGVAMCAYIAAIGLAVLVIRRFVEPGYRLIAAVEGYLLVGAIVALTARL